MVTAATSNLVGSVSFWKRRLNRYAKAVNVNVTRRLHEYQKSTALLEMLLIWADLLEINVLGERSRTLRFDPQRSVNPDFRLAADPQKAAIRSNTAYKALANLDYLCVLET